MISWLPFHFHIVAIALALAAYVLHRRMNATHRQNQLAAIAIISFVVVMIWPIADIAAHVSLLVATVQRLIIMLLVAPLTLLSIPTTWLARFTKPAFTDGLVRRVTHPGFSIIVVTVFGTLTLSAPVVDAGATNSWARGLTILVIFVLGLILWTPALAVVPGTRRLSPAARAGFLIASSIVVTSLSFVWIFSQHPLYPALQHQQQLHMTPLFDQQFAGFIAKLGAYIPMWIVAFQIFFNAERDGVPVEEAPLHYVDIERQLERLERQRRRARRNEGTA
jgi:cytochrome c oxidase assembly factor CtaG